ncbi:MAG: M67 family metallopeptidase [Methylococcales bacterium]|nr:M67 family metallopeptidase [Methylococcales bacterium]
MTSINQKEFNLPLKIIQQLLSHALSSKETEVCGVIGAIEGVVTRCYPITNVHSQPRNKFTLNTIEQIATFKELREHGEKLFAIYHSHPHSPAYPSKTDLALSNYPDALYLIISLNTKGVLELRGFNLKNTQIEEVSLTPYS